MRTDIAYEVIDSRDTKFKLGVMAVLQYIPGGIKVVGSGRRHIDVDLEANDDGLEDDHQNGMVVIHTDDGTVVLDALTVARYRSNVAPRYGEWLDFDDNEACARYFHQVITERE